MTTTARSLAELRAHRFGADPTCNITLTKDGRVRRYFLTADTSSGRFRGAVFIGEAEHRTKRVAGLLDAKRLAQQFAREIKDLLVDGWIEH